MVFVGFMLFIVGAVLGVTVGCVAGAARRTPPQLPRPIAEVTRERDEARHALADCGAELRRVRGDAAERRDVIVGLLKEVDQRGQTIEGLRLRAARESAMKDELGRELGMTPYQIADHLNARFTTPHPGAPKAPAPSS